VVLAAFFVYYGHAPTWSDLPWLPLIILIQLTLTIGLALIIAALTVHFRDLRDLLANLMTLWFFGTPIIYSFARATGTARAILNLNPFTHLAVAYQEVLFVPGPFTAYQGLLAVGVLSVVVLAVGYFVFDRLRETLAEEV
jgi:lipopolysaccharide transport system permease protein